MDLRQWEYFIAVADELSFTRAAEKVFTVQSTISAAIKGLEDEVGVELVDRSAKRQIKLTPAGEAFLPVARHAYQEFLSAQQFALDLAPGLRGQLRVGTMTSLQLVDFPGLFADYRARFPRVDFRVRVAQSGSTGLANAVRNHELDVALVSLPLDLLDDLDVHEVCRVPLALFVSAHHDLAGRGSALIEETAGQDFIETPLGFGSRILVDRAFEQAKVTRRIALEIPDLRVAAEYVAAGLGIAILPRSGFFSSGDVVEVPLAQPIPWILSAVSPKHNHPSRVVRAFLDLLPTHLARRQPEDH